MSRVEVRRNDDGSVDEVLLYDDNSECLFHLEQMDDDLWWFALYPQDNEVHDFDIGRRKKRVVVVER